MKIFYNQKNIKMATLQNVKVSGFFQRVNPELLGILQHSEPIFTAFFSQKPSPPFFSKLSIYHQYLIISQQKRDEMQPVFVLELNETIKFKPSKVSMKNKSKTPKMPSEMSCLVLIQGRHQQKKFYFQCQFIQQMCMLHLSSQIFRADFEDQFKIISRLGTGTTATVKKIQRRADNKLFAVKIFPKEFLESKPARKQCVLNEISLLRSMEHPNILKIHSVYESNSNWYVVTDLLQGGNLRQRIDASKRFKISEVKQIMAGIAKGLKYLHSLGVMHRDIKLENIMLRSWDSLEPVIVDFGLAAISDEEPYIYYRCGTPGYMAPQIAAMNKMRKINVGCDIFSAGVILHILLTNKFLFQGKTNTSVQRNNKNLIFNLGSEDYSQYNKQAVKLMSQMLTIKEEDRITAEGALLHSFLSDCAQANKQNNTLPPVIAMQGELSSNF